MSENFWEDIALDLLEANLNGESLNSDGLKKLFKSRPDVLDGLDIEQNGEVVTNIDNALYGGRPCIIEIREAKPTEIYCCKPCNRTFKRGDNFRRHIRSDLHARRQKAFEISAQDKPVPLKSEEINIS